jgi:phage-related holin
MGGGVKVPIAATIKIKSDAARVGIFHKRVIIFLLCVAYVMSRLLYSLSSQRHGLSLIQIPLVSVRCMQNIKTAIIIVPKNLAK